MPASRRWSVFATVLCLLLSQFTRTTAGSLAHTQKGYLSACLLARDGNADIREWVEYHLWAGVEKIFLFDHNSTVPMFGEVSDYVVEGKVQYTYFSSELPKVKDFKQGLQGRIFQRCFDEARGYFTWMMFTDLDEYLTVSDPSLGHRIPDVLRSFEGSAGAVLMHRRSVGSGGLEARAPGQGVLASFSKCSGAPGDHLKGIAHLDYADVSSNAHMFAYSGGRTGIRVGDNATVLQAHAKANATSSPLLIYHYMGSVGEYARRAELMGSGVSGMTTKDLAFYRRLDSNAKYDCPEPTRIWAQMLKDGAVRPRPASAGPAVAAATVPVKAASAFQVPHQRQRRTQHGWSRVRQAAAQALPQSTSRHRRALQ